MRYVTVKSWRYKRGSKYIYAVSMKLLWEFDTACIKNERYSNSQVAYGYTEVCRKNAYQRGNEAEANTSKDGTSLEWLYTLLLLLQSKVARMQTINNSFTLCSGWRWEVSFTLWAASPCYVLNTRLVGSQSRSGRLGDEISMSHLRIRTTVPRKPSHCTLLRHPFCKVEVYWHYVSD